MKRKNLWLVLVFMLMMTLIFAAGAPVFAASDPANYVFDISEGDITVAAGSGSNIKVTYGASQTTTADFANTQEITITGSNATTANKVVVNTPGLTLNIKLDDVNIEFTTGDSCAFAIVNGTVNLTLTGTNRLTSTSGNPGLQVQGTNTLTIQGAGSLTATGGPFASGIGSGNWQSGGTIIINGGTITAIGGSASSFGGAGIGGGNNASGGEITINDGTVIATGGTRAAGIGGGYEGSGGIITVNGGTVTATGDDYAAGIGGGIYGSGGTIDINDGEITATGGIYAAGIGGGFFAASGNISILSPATVTAVSDGYMPAIDAAGNALEAGSTAYVLMANFSATKNSGTTTGVYLKSDSSLKASYTPDIAYKSIAFTLPQAVTTYQLKTAGILQQHDSSGTDFAIAGAGLTVFGSVADDANAVAVAADKAALTADAIKGENSDLANITVALTNPLPSTGANGSTITWTSDTPAVVSDDGQTVVTPNYGAGNATVVLTATITKGTVTDSKAFTLTVLRNPPIFDIGDGNITVAAGTTADTLKVSYGTAQVLDNIPTDQEIFIIGSSEANKVVVNIPVQTANITLDDVDIELDTTDDCAFSIDTGTVNLTLAGTNTLESTGGNPGLRVTGGKTLTIQGTGSLTATGAPNAAGIGGGYNAGSGTIIINSGTITATGALNAAGIGGGYNAGSGTIIINSGTITATGGCTGIGTGYATYATGGHITIAGGTITATGGSSGAGIGSGGAYSSGGVITITGGTVTATGGGSGAGIGSGGAFSSGGVITISDGMVTATGGSSGAGIGSGGSFSSAASVTIFHEATVVAVSDGTKPAIYAVDDDLEVGSTAYVLMANFSAAKSSGTATGVYLKSDSSLKANFTPDISYKSIAFSLPDADTYQLKTTDKLQQHDGVWNTDFDLEEAGLTIFNSVTDYVTATYTVTVNKDGSAWIEDTPDLELSTESDALTGAVTGTSEDGVYTFTGIDPSQTFYIWDTSDASNEQYTGQSVSAASTDATVEYYSVTLTEGTGIDSTTGGGSYLSGSDVAINATVSDGYIWDKWMQTADNTLVSTTQNYTIDDIDAAQSYTAKALPTRESGIAWTDAGNYDADLYETLTAPDFAETTVEISTPQQLAALARAQDIDGIDFSGVTFTLTQDINLDVYLWDPIGLAEGDLLYGAADGTAHPFKGNFNGNGHVISNMTIDGSYVSAGLFGNINYAGLDDEDAEMVTVSNVTVEGTVDVTDTEYIGGIVGSGGNLILSNCVNQASITGTGDIIIGGGILALGVYVVLDNCVNASGADISVTATSTDDGDMTAGAGGIAGAVFLGSIYDSANFASVTASAAGQQPMAGGILGIGASGTVHNCYNTGAVTADGSISRAGGICGIEADLLETGDPYIRNCYNAGAVTVSDETGYAAGIATMTDGLDSCYYLAGTADCAYYNADDDPVDGTSMSSTEMQADAFCQTLNDWVTANPVSSSFTETYFSLTSIEFQGWVQRDGVNSGYPIFANDPRYVEPTSHGGGSGTVYYTITVQTNVGGFVSPGTSDIKAHVSRTYTITPNNGYKISDVLVDGKSVGAVSSYEFKDVSKSHTLEVIFTKDSQWTNSYNDVRSSDWFYNAIAFVSENGLMNGMGANRFEPGIGTSRAMIVSILWRLEDKPQAGAGKSGVFGDVGEGQWYTDGIEWAATNGVVLGYDAAHFGPNDCITREQLAAILYRYAVIKGYDVSAQSSLEGFADASRISDWALDAVKWAVAEGFLSGVTDTKLDPRGSATRAQVAAILMRFMEKY